MAGTYERVTNVFLNAGQDADAGNFEYIKDKADKLAEAVFDGLHQASPMYVEMAEQAAKAFADGIASRIAKAQGDFADEEMTDLIAAEIGDTPGYFFFADNDTIAEFDRLWAAEDYAGALKMLKDDPELTITDIDSLKAYIDA
jgi:hypothetical protein